MNTATRRPIGAALIAAALLTAAPSSADFERIAPIPALIALGGAGAAQRAADQSNINPAAYEAKSWTALSYDQPFGVDGLRESHARAAAALSPKTALRASWHQFGNALHVEDAVAVSARRGGQSLAVGMRAKLQARRTEGFAGARRYAADLGMLWRPDPLLTVGAVASGPLPSGAGRSAPFNARIGVRIEMSGASAFLADASANENGTGIAVGGEWHPHPKLTLRAGAHNLPWQWAAGFSIRAAALSFDYALETHPALNATHTVGIALYAP